MLQCWFCYRAEHSIDILNVLRVLVGTTYVLEVLCLIVLPNEMAIGDMNKY